MTKVFVSYSHRQKDWVWERLVPVLRAGGAEPLLDKERFRAGLGLPGQMNSTQDQADVHVLCLSHDYYASTACQHEIKRAIALDPHFMRGIVIPVCLDDATLPAAIAAPDPLWVDMRKDSDPEPWQQLLSCCGANLGVAAPVWLNVRDEIVRYLRRRQSVNLVVQSDGIHWRELIWHLRDDEYFPQLACADLQNPGTIPREGLLDVILKELGAARQVRKKPNDLPDFAHILATFTAPLRIVVSHFDLVPHRKGYGIDLFATLRFLAEERRIVLLIQSRTPFASLLPPNSPLSKIDIRAVGLG